MGRELNPQELDELIGAYALDAVDGDEREQVEGWLHRSPAAAAELASLRETAALLAHAGGDAPPGVWSRIEESLEVEPPRLALPTDGVTPLRRTPRRGLAIRIVAGIAAASAAAAAITALVLGDRMSDQEARLTKVARSIERNGMRQAAMAAVGDPDAHTLRLTSDDGMSATVVMMTDGGGFLMADALPRLPDGRAYQLWALTGDPDDPDMVSAAIMSSSTDVVHFQGPATAFGFTITEEDASGAMQPSRDPLVAGRFT